MPHTVIAAIADTIAGLAKALGLAEQLPEHLKTESVEEARKILRWLRNLQASDRDMEEWLSRGEAQVQQEKLKNIQQIISAYVAQLHAAAKKNPGLAREPDVIFANEAVEAMAAAALEYALDTLPKNHPDIAKLEALLHALPESSQKRIGQPVERLLNLLAAGIERVTGALLNPKSHADQLLDLSKRIEQTVHKLRAVDTLEAPVREESIELAREILRRLKDMRFSDKSAQEMVDTGKPEEKLVIAKQLEELADSYSVLLQEAAHANPEILQDARIQEANTAVGNFAHSVKLMAAKEIPVSLAASQQISADVTQTPEEWKGLSGRTAGRLMQSMEAGLERAVDELVAQAEQQQQEEAAQAATETHNDHHKKRRKRRRSSSSRSGAGGGKARKVAQDISADDRVLNQGRFREAAIDRPIPSVMPGLSGDALAAVKQLGNSLLGISNQAKDLSAAQGDMAINDPRLTESKNFTRDAERDKQNPRPGSQGPRVS